MTKNIDPTAAAAKWANNTGNATQAWKDGIGRVKVAPGQLAAAQADTWAQNVAAAKSRYATNVGRVTLAAWQQATEAKSSNFATGVQAGAAKQAAFMQAFLPKVNQAAATLPARGSYAANKARAVAMMDALHAMKGQFKQ